MVLKLLSSIETLNTIIVIVGACGIIIAAIIGKIAKIRMLENLSTILFIISAVLIYFGLIIGSALEVFNILIGRKSIEALEDNFILLVIILFSFFVIVISVIGNFVFNISVQNKKTHIDVNNLKKNNFWPDIFIFSSILLFSCSLLNGLLKILSGIIKLSEIYEARGSMLYIVIFVMPIIYFGNLYRNNFYKCINIDQGIIKFKGYFVETRFIMKRIINIQCYEKKFFFNIFFNIPILKISYMETKKRKVTKTIGLFGFRSKEISALKVSIENINQNNYTRIENS